MENANFQLFVGVYPAGVVYCNKAVEEFGDYKKIAFINEFGALRFYVPVASIPGDELLRIDHGANAARARFREKWEAKTNIDKLCFLGDLLPFGLLGVPEFETLEDKIDYLEFACFGWVPHSVRVLDELIKNNVKPLFRATTYYNENN